MLRYRLPDGSQVKFINKAFYVYTTFSRALRLRVVLFPDQAVIQPVKMLSMMQVSNVFENVEAYTELPWPSEEEEVLVSFLHHCLRVRGQCEVLSDMNRKLLTYSFGVPSVVMGCATCPVS